MKVLLIYSGSNVFSKATVVPLGIAYIAACLEKAGHDVKVQDLSKQRLDEKAFGWADIVGISMLTPGAPSGFEVVRKAKEANPNLTIILGGPHPSALPEECLAVDGVDGIIIGEGEETFVEIADMLEKGNRRLGKGNGGIAKGKSNPLPNIRGLFTGKKFEPRPIIKDLDALPFPAYHLFDFPNGYGNPQPLLSYKLPAGTLLTSRGCPFKCGFCFKGVFGSSIRLRSPDSVVEEWRMLVDDYKVKEIGIQDDIFNYDQKRAIEICRLLRKEKLDIPWITHNGIRLNYMSRELMHEMRKAGCHRTGLGIESGNQGILNKMHKGITLDMARAGRKHCRDAGIKTVGFFIMGYLYETRKTMMDTIKFAIELDVDYAQFTIAAPFPGSELYKVVKEEGKLLVTDWGQYDQMSGGHAYFEHGDLTKELVEEMWHKAYKMYNLRPKQLLRFAKNPVTWRNLPETLGAAKRSLVHKSAPGCGYGKEKVNIKKREP